MSKVTRRNAIKIAAAGLFMPNIVRAQQPMKATVSCALRIANYLPAWIAQQKGLFAKHNLQVDIIAAGTVAEPISIINAERAQIAMTATAMAVNSSAEGAPMKVISAVSNANGLWAIARPGTKIKSLEDFKGRSIATFRFPSTTLSSPMFAMKMVGKFDPAAAGVKFIEGPLGSIIPAVKSGRADIGCVFEWDASIAEVEGLEVVFAFADALGPRAFTSAMVRADFVKQNPRVVQAFCNGMAEAMNLIRAEPAVYEDVAIKEFSQVPANIVKRGTARLLQTDGFVPKNPVITKDLFDGVIAHEISAGTMRNPLPFEQIVDNSFAEKAAAEFGIRK
jgi:NitT/TauT family transport system substrate-binding protein